MERIIRKLQERLRAVNTAEMQKGNRAGINHTEIFFLNLALQCGQRITFFPSVKYSPKSVELDLDSFFFKSIYWVKR